eukprot:3940766-Rhodomonas_salina.2
MQVGMSMKRTKCLVPRPDAQYRCSVPLPQPSTATQYCDPVPPLLSTIAPQLRTASQYHRPAAQYSSTVPLRQLSTARQYQHAASGYQRGNVVPFGRDVGLVLGLGRAADGGTDEREGPQLHHRDLQEEEEGGGGRRRRRRREEEEEAEEEEGGGGGEVKREERKAVCACRCGWMEGQMREKDHSFIIMPGRGGGGGGGSRRGGERRQERRGEERRGQERRGERRGEEERGEEKGRGEEERGEEKGRGGRRRRKAVRVRASAR